MSFCPFFKNGYFAVCTASGSDHVPGIAEMENYCFRENNLCTIYESYTLKKNRETMYGNKCDYITGLSTNPSDK